MLRRTLILCFTLVSPLLWAVDAFDLMLQEQEAVRAKQMKERANFVYPGPERFTDKNTKDDVIALRWFAAAGDVTSQAALADLYAKGIIMPKDLKTAVYWYQLAGEYGNTYAQYMMAISYHLGWLEAPNAEKADEWFKRTKKEPDRVNAMRQVAQFFNDKDSALYNPGESYKWYEKAAYAGDVTSQLQLADWYYQGGNGLSKNLMVAIKWYGKAASKHSEYAQYSLGLIYLHGEKEIPIDYSQALMWLKKAADQGFTAAQYTLGDLYYTGTGVPANNVLAYAWWRQAKSTLNPAVDEKLAQVTTKMTMDEIEQAIKLSDYFDSLRYNHPTYRLTP